MPIYEYKCLECDYTFEKIQKIKDKPLTQCSKCGGIVQKLIGKCAFHLKGEGWAAQGYNFCNMEASRLDKEATQELEEDNKMRGIK